MSLSEQSILLRLLAESYEEDGKKADEEESQLDISQLDISFLKNIPNNPLLHKLYRFEVDIRKTTEFLENTMKLFEDKAFVVSLGLNKEKAKKVTQHFSKHLDGISNDEELSEADIINKLNKAFTYEKALPKEEFKSISNALLVTACNNFSIIKDTLTADEKDLAKKVLNASKQKNASAKNPEKPANTPIMNLDNFLGR